MITRRQEPGIIQGARGPKDVRDTSVSDKLARKAAQLQRAPEGKVRYQAAYANLRIQVTAPSDQRDPFTGRILPGRPKAAQFRNHFYDVSEKETDTIQWLDEHPAYGKKFWRLEDVIAEAKRQQVESVRKFLIDPENREAVLEALKTSGIADFQLPPAESINT